MKRGFLMFKTILKSSILASSILFVVSGCTSTKDSVSKEYDKVQTTKQHLEVAAQMQKDVTTQETLEATIASLAAQMVENKKMDTNKPILITSFVRLDEFKQTSEFGRVVSESLINELSNRGFEITEFRGQMAVSINDEGEYFISRKPNELKNKTPNTYVVVGTYSRQMGKIMLNARVIDNVTGKIITSARATYVHNIKEDCIIFKDCAPARTINIVKEK
jgi:TolB-like protein